MYSVKEIFYTLQGEGAQSGRPAVFCRFSGCNLWSGQERHRATAQCTFCDTDFVGTDGVNGGRFTTAAQLAERIARLWPDPNAGEPYVVFTGGEPLLQLDSTLIEAMHQRGFSVGVETNGTLPAPPGIDWLCVSPKGRTELVITRCDELKLVYPQPDAPPERFRHIAADYYYLTPMADPQAPAESALYRDAITRQTIAYCLRHPQWRLNLQSHKVVAID